MDMLTESKDVVWLPLIDFFGGSMGLFSADIPLMLTAAGFNLITTSARASWARGGLVVAMMKLLSGPTLPKYRVCIT